MSEQHVHVCTCEKEEARTRNWKWNPGHAAGQGSTFAFRVHIIPGMFAKNTCRRKMIARGEARGMHFVAGIGIRARYSFPLFISFYIKKKKKKKCEYAPGNLENAKKRISLEQFFAIALFNLRVMWDHEIWLRN